MTACASPEVSTSLEQGVTPSSAAVNENEWAARAGCVITVDGSYAARLARSGDSWFPERWTLDGPEPYAVPLPGTQPEEPGTEVLPMADGRVLIHRLADGRHVFSLLYPTGPGTGEVPLGAVQCPDEGAELRLLPPAPGGTRAYALAVGRSSTAVWLVSGGAFGPEHLAEVPGRCSGGVWLGGGDRLLALDRELDGRTKTVVVDLERGGEVSPLLQIAEKSNDRLLLADADSGLLLIRSDAPSPGQERLGWGVLGSTLPVRFPECLHLPGRSVTPFAIQPGQVLTPESCAVALRIDGPSASWLGVWRPAERHVHQLPAPEGWLTGSGRWSKDGVLHLPYATGAVPCGVSRVEAPTGAGDGGPGDPDSTAEASGDAPQGPSVTGPPEPATPRPVPLQQAPLTGRMVANAFAGRRLAQGVGGGRRTGESAGRASAGGVGRAAVGGSGWEGTGGVRRAADGGAGWAGAEGRASIEGVDRTAAAGADRTSSEGMSHAATEGVDRTPAEGTGWARTEGVDHTPAEGTGWTRTERLGSAADEGTGWTRTEGADRTAAAGAGAGSASAEAMSHAAAEGTGRAGTERVDRTAAESTGWTRTEGMSHPATRGANPGPGEGTSCPTSEHTSRASAQSTSHTTAESANPGPSEATGHPTTESTRSAADESPLRMASASAGNSGPMPAAQHTVPAPTESIHPAARPTPAQAEPLRVERVSAEAPPDFRTLRMTAQTAPAPGVERAAPEAPRAVHGTGETNPSPTPLKVTTE